MDWYLTSLMLILFMMIFTASCVRNCNYQYTYISEQETECKPLSIANIRAQIITVIMGMMVSNHQPKDCLLNHLFRGRSKKTSKLRVTGLCEGNSPMTSEFPTQRASNMENVSIWWCHHGTKMSSKLGCHMLYCNAACENIPASMSANKGN